MSEHPIDLLEAATLELRDPNVAEYDGEDGYGAVCRNKVISERLGWARVGERRGERRIEGELTDEADFAAEVSVLSVLHVRVDEADDRSNGVASEGSNGESLVPQRFGGELGADGPRDAGPGLGEGGEPKEDCG